MGPADGPEPVTAQPRFAGAWVASSGIRTQGSFSAHQICSFRSQPAWVVERAGLNERDGPICHAVALDMGAAVETEESVERLAARAAMNLVTTRTAAGYPKAMLRHGEVHRESGTRVLAAGVAMADHLHQRLSVRAVAQGTTEAFLPAGSPQCGLGYRETLARSCDLTGPREPRHYHSHVAQRGAVRSVEIWPLCARKNKARSSFRAGWIVVPMPTPQLGTPLASFSFRCSLAE